MEEVNEKGREELVEKTAEEEMEEEEMEEGKVTLMITVRNRRRRTRR